MDCTIAVRAQDANSCALQTLQHFHTGMAVGIFRTGRNERELRPDVCEKIRQRGVLAAVVADFEHVCAQPPFIYSSHDLVLGLLLDVARQE